MPIPVGVLGGPAQLTWYIGQDDKLYGHELQTDCLFTLVEDISSIDTGVAEAPADGQTYARQDTGWTALPPIPATSLLITGIQPVSALESTTPVITVNGSGFTATSVVNWGGYALNTTFVNNASLTSSLNLGPGSAGIYTVWVTDQGQKSNSVAFTVDPAAKFFTVPGASCILDINADGDLIITQTQGPNAGKSVNLTYGKWT